MPHNHKTIGFLYQRATMRSIDRGRRKDFFLGWWQ